jgi:hypothetical protein
MERRATGMVAGYLVMKQLLMNVTIGRRREVSPGNLVVFALFSYLCLWRV